MDGFFILYWWCFPIFFQALYTPTSGGKTTLSHRLFIPSHSVRNQPAIVKLYTMRLRVTAKHSPHMFLFTWRASSENSKPLKYRAVGVYEIQYWSKKGLRIDDAFRIYILLAIVKIFANAVCIICILQNLNDCKINHFFYFFIIRVKFVGTKCYCQEGNVVCATMTLGLIP